MDPYSSSSTSPPSAAAVMGQLKDQIQQAYAEELMETLRTKCFAKCITKPGSTLSGGEQSCTSRCVERYFEAQQIIGRSIYTHLSQQQPPR